MRNEKRLQGSDLTFQGLVGYWIGFERGCVKKRL